MAVRFRELTFDADRRQVTRANGDELHLTPKAFDLLALLLEAAPRVVTKRELHERLWPGTFVSDATLVGVVKELRRVLGDCTDSPIIKTAHRVGYAFCPVLESPGSSPSAIQHWIVAGDRTLPLKEGENLIGRDPASAVWLEAAGVSRRHARIVVDAGRVQLEDLGSKNGTMCRDQMLTAPAALQSGDRIRIGPVVLVYRWCDAGMSTESAVARLPAAASDAGT